MKRLCILSVKDSSYARANIFDAQRLMILSKYPHLELENHEFEPILIHLIEVTADTSLRGFALTRQATVASNLHFSSC